MQDTGSVAGGLTMAPDGWQDSSHAARPGGRSRQVISRTEEVEVVPNRSDKVGIVEIHRDAHEFFALDVLRWNEALAFVQVFQETPLTGRPGIPAIAPGLVQRALVSRHAAPAAYGGHANRPAEKGGVDPGLCVIEELDIRIKEAGRIVGEPGRTERRRRQIDLTLEHR